MTDKAKQYHHRIQRAVRKHRTKADGVYTGELQEATGLDKQVICRWLRQAGYEKYGGHMSQYWRKVTV